MNKIIPVNSIDDIDPKYISTPIEKLLKYQNLDFPFEKHNKPELLIGMCMDNRKQLRLPENFAYIMRTGGGNLRFSEFKVSYAVSIGELSTIALIAHNNCGMVNLMSVKSKFINGLVEYGGWEKERAEEHFVQFAPIFEIENEIDFALGEAHRLNRKYPKVNVVPLFYNIDNGKLSQLHED